MATGDTVNMSPDTVACVSHHTRLPMVLFIHAKVAAVLSCCMANTVISITPVVEVGVNSVKAKMKEFGIPSLSDVNASVNTAVFTASAAVEKLSRLARGVPSLTGLVRTPTPALILETVQDMANSYGVSTVGSMASFSLAQVMLKVTDTGLGVLGERLRSSGVSDRVWCRVNSLQITTSTIRMLGFKTARTGNEKKMEKVSTFGICFLVVIIIILEVFI
eukprot:GFUD01040051.1.p1 GENE.GFUD01040051.1~~GFUD01040051.1.p1  ORF type:complete len:219 (-),score=24.31 GFUD01040051.1:46-702(-)